MSKIYLDADGCPVREEVYKVTARYQVPVILVANKALQIPDNPLIEMKVVSGQFDAADDWIVEQAKSTDLVVTTDILLADRLIRNSVRVLTPKGHELTEDNVGMAVANREFSQNLRHMGERAGGPSPMDKTARSRFLAKLDEIIQALLRAEKSRPR